MKTSLSLVALLWVGALTTVDAQQALPAPPEPSGFAEVVADPGRPLEIALPPLIALEPTEEMRRLTSMPSIDAFAMSIALNEAAAAKSIRREISAIIWGVLGGLGLTMGASLLGLGGPAGLEILLLTSGPAMWSIEMLIDESPEEDLHVAWKRLRSISQVTQLARFERHLAALAAEEQAHRTRTSILGFVFAGLGITAILGTISADGPIGFVPLGVLSFALGLVMGVGSLGPGSTQTIYDRYLLGVFRDPTYEGT